MNLSYDILGAQVLESQIQNTSLFYKSSIAHKRVKKGVDNNNKIIAGTEVQTITNSFE